MSKPFDNVLFWLYDDRAIAAKTPFNLGSLFGNRTTTWQHCPRLVGRVEPIPAPPRQTVSSSTRRIRQSCIVETRRRLSPWTGRVPFVVQKRTQPCHYRNEHCLPHSRLRAHTATRFCGGHRGVPIEQPPHTRHLRRPLRNGSHSRTTRRCR